MKKPDIIGWSHEQEQGATAISEKAAIQACLSQMNNTDGVLTKNMKRNCIPSRPMRIPYEYATWKWAKGYLQGVEFDADKKEMIIQPYDEDRVRTLPNAKIADKRIPLHGWNNRGICPNCKSDCWRSPVIEVETGKAEWWCAGCYTFSPRDTSDLKERLNGWRIYQRRHLEQKDDMSKYFYDLAAKKISQLEKVIQEMEMIA